MKILNLYAGIGGNRKLWGDEHQVTAVEYEPFIAEIYKELHPNDTVVVADAHQYLIENFKEFDFIWSSPPCPTHSRTSTGLTGWGIYRYPDMKLYEEIIFLKHFYKGDWVVENVIPYYKPLIEPTATVDRHYIWSSKPVENWSRPRAFKGGITDLTVAQLQDYHGVRLPDGAKQKRKLLRNMVHPDMGEHILKQVLN